MPLTQETHVTSVEPILDKIKQDDPTLKKLTISLNKSDEIGIIQLTDALKTNTHLTSLRISGKESIGDEGARALAESLKQNRTINALEVSYSSITLKGAQALSEMLRENNTLVSFRLAGNSIGAEGMRYLADAIKANKTLTTFGFWDEDIGEEGALALADMLQDNSTLVYFFLQSNNLGKRGTKAITDALENNRTLTELLIRCNSIDDEAMDGIAGIIKNGVLTKLDLAQNKIGAKGEQKLGLALKTNRTLTYLYLNYNHNLYDMTEDMAIADALQFNQTLRHLFLGCTRLKIKQVEKLSFALTINSNLETLDLCMNDLSDEGAIALASTLLKNKSIATLLLDSRTIGVRGIKAFADVLKVNQSLSTLYLNNNSGGDEGICELAEALKLNNHLSRLRVSPCKFGESGAQALIDMLQINKTITDLSCDLYEFPKLKETIRLQASKNECEFFQQAQELYQQAEADLHEKRYAEAIEHLSNAITMRKKTYRGPDIELLTSRLSGAMRELSFREVMFDPMVRQAKIQAFKAKEKETNQLIKEKNRHLTLKIIPFLKEKLLQLQNDYATSPEKLVALQLVICDLEKRIAIFETDLIQERYATKMDSIVKAQSYIRGFFAQKEVKKRKEERTREVDIGMETIIPFLEIEKRFSHIEELKLAVSENRLHDAMQILRNREPKELEYEGLQLRY